MFVIEQAASYYVLLYGTILLRSSYYSSTCIGLLDSNRQGAWGDTRARFHAEMKDRPARNTGRTLVEATAEFGPLLNQQEK